MPTKIIYGNNEIDNIDKYINGKKTLLVTSDGFVKRGLVKQIKSLTNNIVRVISNIKSHPEFKDLEIIYNGLKDKNKKEKYGQKLLGKLLQKS